MRRVSGFSAVAAALCLFVLLIAALAVTAEKPKDFLVPLIAAVAVAVSLMAWYQSRRSAAAAQTNATIAEAQEGRRRFGWSVTRHPDGDNLVLRNLGTVAALNVQLEGDFALVEFVVGDEGTVEIAPGEAKAFRAVQTFSRLGTEVVISWMPEGHSETQSWREVLPPERDRSREARERRSERDVIQAQAAREDRKQTLDLLLRLAVAYPRYAANRDDPAAKLEVQALVTALPPQYVREIGFQVDAARDCWGPWEYPFEDLIHPDRWTIAEPYISEIELLWNIRQVAGYEIRVAEPGERYEFDYRIEQAIDGFVSRVMERESGTRKTRHSEADQRQADEATAMFAQMESRFPQTEEAPSGATEVTEHEQHAAAGDESQEPYDAGPESGA